MHTSQLERYGHVVGRYLFKYERPKPTKRGEKYREPKLVERKRFKNKSEAELANTQWSGLLV